MGRKGRNWPVRESVVAPPLLQVVPFPPGVKLH